MIMKKYLFILATAAIVVSCSDQDTFKKDIQAGDGEAISFESFTSKQTRAENSDATYDWDLFDHHTTFEVWGFKNNSETEVFKQDVVTVAETTGNYTYTYSPLRYWDKAAAMYEFYAAAPSGNKGNWTFERNNLVAAEITDANKRNIGYFTTSSTLNGTNITVTTGADKYKYVNSFKSTEDNADIDKLIAAPKAVAKNGFNQVIQLDFIHILSRLNVTIKKAATLDGTTITNSTSLANTQKVILKDLKVVNLKEAGSFDEHKTLVATGTNTRWDAENASGRTTPFIYRSVANPTASTPTTYEVTSSEAYVLQSLVIPQTAAFANVALDGNHYAEIAAGSYATVDQYNLDHEPDITQTEFNALSDAEKAIAAVPEMIAINKNEDALTDAPYLKITYTIKQMTDASGADISLTSTEEEFTAYFNLAAAFGMDGTTGKTAIAFNEGWQNTLNITIQPAEIQFCAKVAEWSEVEKDLPIY